jgi:nicotinamide-nucleotide amidase
MIAQSVVKKLIKKKATLCVAESITGGGLAAAITDIAGSSKVFLGGVIAYEDSIKISELKVDAKLLKKFTAVSEEVAKEMAVGALKKFKTDYAIATTGVAGPGKAYGQKAGTVWVAIASKKEVFAIALSLSGSRDLIRHATIESALASFERILKP